MSLEYRSLSPRVRKFMLEELELSERDQKIYVSSYLSDRGKADWVGLLRAACESGNDAPLATELSNAGRLLTRTTRKAKNGGHTVVDVPYTANDTLAEGQFNRLYIRGVCRCAIEDGTNAVHVYRAAERANERTASKALVGTDLDATALLAKLRNALDFESGFPEPNTGLTVMLLVVSK